MRRRVHADPGSRAARPRRWPPALRPGRPGAVLEPARGAPLAGRAGRLRPAPDRDHGPVREPRPAAPRLGVAATRRARPISSAASRRTGSRTSAPGHVMLLADPSALDRAALGEAARSRASTSSAGRDAHRHRRERVGRRDRRGPARRVRRRCRPAAGDPSARPRPRSATRGSPTTSSAVDGVPAAVARRATFDGLSYLSSIGTAGWARGRGFGGLVTAAAAAGRGRGRAAAGLPRGVRRQPAGHRRCTSGSASRSLGGAGAGPAAGRMSRRGIAIRPGRGDGPSSAERRRRARRRRHRPSAGRPSTRTARSPSWRAHCGMRGASSRRAVGALGGAAARPADGRAGPLVVLEPTTEGRARGDPGPPWTRGRCATW